MQKGVFKAKKKNGEIYYRASITFSAKHISLGSFSTEDYAHKAYIEADKILYDLERKINIENFKSKIKYLDLDKAISLINFRDRKTYIKTPIYLREGYFSYFLFSYEETPPKIKIRELKFSNDDLFYYSQHRILIHDGHFYVNDYGMQYGIFARFGIKNFAVKGRDYDFSNGDENDFRYDNIIIFSKYHGVICHHENGLYSYETRIKINGEFRIGIYHSEKKAAIAYNKASDFAKKHGIKKDFPQNYIDEISPKEYAEIYTNVKLPENFIKYFS